MRWLAITTRLWPFIVAAVHGVEALRPAAQSTAKQDAAVQMVHAMAGATSTDGVHELLTHPNVDAALREAIDAYVQLHNSMADAAAKAPAAVEPAAPAGT